MSITFTQVSKVTFDETSFADYFDKELKDAAKSVGIPFKTKFEKEAFISIIWNLVLDEIGDEYDMDDNDDNDGEELDEATAGFAIKDTVQSVIADYTSKVAKQKADAFEAAKAETEFFSIIKNEAEAAKGLSEEDDDWQMVYNGNGRPREYCNQPGTFYQTYGNGGGKNGWGGYWVREDGEAVWEVAGQEFMYLPGCALEFQSENEMTGRIAAVRIIPLDQKKLYEKEKAQLLAEMAELKRKIRLERQRE